MAAVIGEIAIGIDMKTRVETGIRNTTIAADTEVARLAHWPR
jgi:hypothetical protein